MHADNPVYDNRGVEGKSKPELPVRNSDDYASAYDVLQRQSHPYEYAGREYNMTIIIFVSTQFFLYTIYYFESSCLLL